jgi:hypothetical protein
MFNLFRHVRVNDRFTTTTNLKSLQSIPRGKKIDNMVYRQKIGMAIETKVAPIYTIHLQKKSYFV